MAYLGSTAKPTYGQEWTGLNTLNQQAMLLTMPTNGSITRVGGWLAGKDAAVSFYFCVWNSGGTLLAQSAVQTAAALGFGLGQSIQYEANLTAAVAAVAGQQYYIGWSRNPSGAAQFGRNASGTHYDDTQTGTYPGSLAGLSADTAGTIGAYAVYSTAALPNAPVLISPANGAIVATAAPSLVFDHSDPNGDPVVSYDLQVDDNTAFTTPIWSPGGQSTGIVGTRITLVYNGPSLTRGTTYYWRARTRDVTGVGPYSGYRSFRLNRLPTVTKTSPAAAGSGLAYIHNLADLAVWTSGGSHAKAQFSWAFGDGDADAQGAFQIQVGTDGSTAGVGDSGVVTSSTKSYNAPWALVMGTVYYWRIQVKDSRGEWSGWTSWTTFKVRWGQAIYEYAVSGGSSTGSWSWANGSVSASTQAAFLFATATGAAGAGRSAWKTAVGALTPAAYFNVMVRLATPVSGTNPALPDMTFTYIATAIQPDHWAFSHSTEWILDDDVRRFGTKSLRCVVATTVGNRYAYPFLLNSGDEVPVVGGTDMTYSMFVKTLAPLTGVASVSLRVRPAGGGAPIIDGTTVAGAWAQDTAAYPDGWQRLTLRFTVPPGSTAIRPMVFYTHNGVTAGDTFWVDAAKLEEGNVATAWSPGFVGRSVVLDSGGIAVDASQGGSFRLRDESATTIALGSQGLEMDEGWIAPSLLNSWVNYGGAFETAGYRKDASGYVHLKGLVKSGTANTIIFTLPAGYRPIEQGMFAVNSGAAAFGRIDLTTGGDVTMNSGSTTWLSLSGINFKAEG